MIEAAVPARRLQRSSDQELLDGLLPGRAVPVPVEVDDRREDLRRASGLNRNDLYPVPVRDRNGAVGGTEVDAVGTRFANSSSDHGPITIPPARTYAEAPGCRRCISSSSIPSSRCRPLNRSRFFSTWPRRAERVPPR